MTVGEYVHVNRGMNRASGKATYTVTRVESDPNK